MFEINIPYKKTEKSRRVYKCDAERNELWLVVWHVSQRASWAGLGQWTWPTIPELQSEGLATRDYLEGNIMLATFWNNLLVRSASLMLLKCFLSRQLIRFWNRAVPLHMNTNKFVCMGFQTIQSFFLSTTILLFLFQAISSLVSYSSCQC